MKKSLIVLLFSTCFFCVVGQPTGFKLKGSGWRANRDSSSFKILKTLTVMDSFKVVATINNKGELTVFDSLATIKQLIYQLTDSMGCYKRLQREMKLKSQSRN